MDSLPPDPDLGRTMVIATAVMHLFSIPLYAGRMYGRIRPVWRVTWDGYFLTGAVVKAPFLKLGSQFSCR